MARRYRISGGAAILPGRHAAINGTFLPIRGAGASNPGEGERTHPQNGWTPCDSAAGSRRSGSGGGCARTTSPSARPVARRSSRGPSSGQVRVDPAARRSSGSPAALGRPARLSGSPGTAKAWTDCWTRPMPTSSRRSSRALEASAWQTATEISFNHFGRSRVGRRVRASIRTIDVVAGRRGEVGRSGRPGDLDERSTGRRASAPEIAAARGWPAQIASARLLVVTGDSDSTAPDRHSMPSIVLQRPSRSEDRCRPRDGWPTPNPR